MDHAPITHVAMRFRGQLWSLPRPYRHHHIIRIIAYLNGMFGDGQITHVDAHGDDQGFLDAAGQYLTRKQAHARAALTGQIKDPTKVYGTFTSENVW